MSVSKRLEELGITLPSTGGGDDYYGKRYGKMRSHYIVDRVLFMSGQTAGLVDGQVRYPGRVGRDLTVDDAYQAARITGLNCLGCLVEAVGDLDRVKGLVRSLNFVACDPEFTEPHRVASGLTDVFEQVFGSEIGVGPRASIGVMSLADNYCFVTWMTVELR